MSNDQVIHNLLMSESEATATVDAPIDTVDIADWVLNLPDAEYQALRAGRTHRCGPDHHG